MLHEHIMPKSEHVTRSCKDESKVSLDVLKKRMIAKTGKRRGMKHLHIDAVKYLSHAVELHLKDFITKITVATSHRTTNFQPASNSKAQLDFFQKLDELKSRRCEEDKRTEMV